ncbi:hypothetical protein JW805_20935 [Roseomonas aeriglobus]|nr:hypothetical protein [Roseomonas aeriglobus]MBN2974457.1 hypothetical protein [Roseomonas aeriglobus]
MADILDALRDRVLFVSYGGGHAASLAPVAKELERRGVPFSILGLTTAASYFARHSLEPLGMADLVGRVPGYEHAVKTGERLAAGQPRHGAVSATETAAYLGAGYIALERMYGAEEAQRRYDRFNRQSFRPLDFFDRLFAAVRPRVLVATNSPRSEQAALSAAGSAGIASLCLVDLYAAFEIEWCAAPGYADRVCVLNETIAERFRTRGADPAAVRVTGNPAFDRLGLLDRHTVRARHRAALGLRDGDRLIVWISQPEPQLHPFSGVRGDPSLPARIETELAQGFADASNVYLVMRLHPSEDRGPAVTGDRLRYGTASEPLDDLLCAADCVVTCSSTVGVEAGLLGIPVVQVMRSIFSRDLPLADMGYATAATGPEDLKARIVDAFATGLRDPARVGITFDAAGRVADEIAGLRR